MAEYVFKSFRGGGVGLEAGGFIGRPTWDSENPGQSFERLIDYVEAQFQEIESAFLESLALELRPIHAAPKRPREGMIVFADGTDWNPGAGKGVYTYSGGVWSKL